MASEIDHERRRRILVAAWAYAYEVESTPLVDDETFDREAALIRPEIETGHAALDEFFRTGFDPCTGMWVHCHPEKHKLRRVCAIMRSSD